MADSQWLWWAAKHVHWHPLVGIKTIKQSCKILPLACNLSKIILFSPSLSFTKYDFGNVILEIMVEPTSGFIFASYTGLWMNEQVATPLFLAPSSGIGSFFFSATDLSSQSVRGIVCQKLQDSCLYAPQPPATPFRSLISLHSQPLCSNCPDNICFGWTQTFKFSHLGLFIPWLLWLLWLLSFPTSNAKI